jgi:hypothetical protein
MLSSPGSMQSSPRLAHSAHRNLGSELRRQCAIEFATGGGTRLPLSHCFVTLLKFIHGAERCPSGLRSTLGKRVLGKLNRGFESHPLRHSVLRFSQSILNLTEHENSWIHLRKSRKVHRFMPA